MHSQKQAGMCVILSLRLAIVRRGNASACVCVSFAICVCSCFGCFLTTIPLLYFATMASTRKYDVIVYGATGYTGKLCAAYLATHSGSPRWALGGRNKTRLQNLRSSLKLSESVGTVQADSTDYASLLAMAEQTAVVINIAGPYRRNNAIEVIRACVEKGTSYVDLSGESGFNSAAIEKFHAAAQEKHVIIAPSVGFDSLPFDLTTYLAAKHAKATAGGGDVEVLTADCGVLMKGAVSTGTISSAIDMAEVDSTQLQCTKPDWLSPVQGSHKVSWYASRFFPQFGRYGAFTPFTTHNHRIVNRTWGLLEQSNAKERFGKKFQYQDGMILPARAIAWIASIVVTLNMTLLNFSLVRWFLRKTLTENGGPSES